MKENDFYEMQIDDRIAKIRSVNDEYNLQKCAYLSFSGGRDSTMLHFLLDEALPGNKIRRVFFDTGIDFHAIKSFVLSFARNDSRFVIVPSGVNIQDMLNKYGYPFMNKQHSHRVSIYQKSGITKTVEKYLSEDNKGVFSCPPKLRYNFSPSFHLKIDDTCCRKLKKEVSAHYMKDNHLTAVITGMRRAEKGQRAKIDCILTSPDRKNPEKTVLNKFHPLAPVGDDLIDYYYKQRDLPVCELYEEPCNFSRTGCIGCPFSNTLKDDLFKMSMYLPKEFKKCIALWGEVYNEYAEHKIKRFDVTFLNSCKNNAERCLNDGKTIKE